MKSKVIEFNGIKFRRYPDSPKRSDRVYYRPSGSYIKKGVGYLHQEIWKAKHGKIPDGYHIHHKDGNPLNNDIDNLECVKGDQHISKHSSEHPPGKQHMEMMQNKAKEWHRSKEGSNWHKKHWHKSLGKYLKETEEKKCLNCGKQFKTNVSHSKFCSNACKSAYRRKSGIDNEKRTCVICGKEFEANKYSKKKTCSRKCATKLIVKNRQSK